MFCQVQNKTLYLLFHVSTDISKTLSIRCFSIVIDLIVIKFQQYIDKALLHVYKLHH